MKRFTIMATALATAALAASLVAGSAAAAPALTTHLYAKAGPVKMHADLTLTGTQVTTGTAISALHNCTVKQGANPRSGVADKLVCTSASGHVVVVAAPTNVSLSYRLGVKTGMSMAQMSVQIRSGSTTLFQLGSSTGTVSVPTSHLAGLLNGHDKLVVQAGGHTYSGVIHQVS